MGLILSRLLTPTAFWHLRRANSPTLVAAVSAHGSTILGRALRIGLYAVLGWLGLYGLAFPLFGYLSYIGALLFPLVVVIEVAGVVLALTRRGRWGWVYVLGNIGVLTVTFVVFVAGLAEVAMHWQPDTEATAPLYLAFTSLGLVLGVLVGARMQRPAP